MPQIPNLRGFGFPLGTRPHRTFLQLGPTLFISTAGAHEPTSERTQATTCEGTTQACQGTLVSSKRFSHSERPARRRPNSLSIIHRLLLCATSDLFVLATIFLLSPLRCSSRFPSCFCFALCSPVSTYPARPARPGVGGLRLVIQTLVIVVHRKSQVLLNIAISRYIEFTF